jgi:WD40 repeat protein
MSQNRSTVRALDFTGDARTLASGGEDGRVKLWKPNPAAEHEVASFAVDALVWLVRFSPDDNTLAIVTDDGALRLLRAVSLKEADEEADALGL